jgi:natural product precursor
MIRPARSGQEVAMKKATRKLSLPKETLRKLQVPELEVVIGGATLTCDCGASCGNRHSTCPV